MEYFGTIGPACKDIHILAEMFRQGMTGIRLNVSHSSLSESGEWVKNVHLAASENGIKSQILIDLQGPELRVGKFAEPKVYVLKEQEVIFLGLSQGKEQIPVTKEVLLAIAEKQEILLDDGKILLRAEAKAENDCVKCRVVRGGELQQRKSIALPGVFIETPTLTYADIENLKVAKSFGVTGVMLPFVRGKKDLQNLRETLQRYSAENIQIYAKIENLSGVEALEEIIDEADTVVIARGDLGNAMPLWKLPAVQKKIAAACNAKKRKFMVVTQMLASMEGAKVPTRAEVSDIFNAVLDGADSVMLTGETAAGKYPAEAMRYLVKTAEEATKFCIEN